MAEILQNAYLANTKGFSKYGVGLVSGPKIFFGGGVLQGRYGLWTPGPRDTSMAR